MEALRHNESQIEKKNNNQESKEVMESPKDLFDKNLQEAREIPDYQMKQIEKYGGSQEELHEQLKEVESEIAEVSLFEKFSPTNVINKSIESFKNVGKAKTAEEKLDALMKLPGVTGIKDDWQTGEVTRYGPLDFLK